MHGDEDSYQVGDTADLDHEITDSAGNPVAFDELYLSVERGGAYYDRLSLAAGEIQLVSQGIVTCTYVFQESGNYAFEWQARGAVSDTTPAFEDQPFYVAPAQADAPSAQVQATHTYTLGERQLGILVLEEVEVDLSGYTLRLYATEPRQPAQMLGEVAGKPLEDGTARYELSFAAPSPGRYIVEVVAEQEGESDVVLLPEAGERVELAVTNYAYDD